MKQVFYDMKDRVLRELTVTERKIYKTKGGERYMIIAKTKDGRNLFKFCKKEIYDAVK